MTDEEFFNAKAEERSAIESSASENAFQTVWEEFKIDNPFMPPVNEAAVARFYRIYRLSYEFMTDIS